MQKVAGFHSVEHVCLTLTLLNGFSCNDSAVFQPNNMDFGKLCNKVKLHTWKNSFPSLKLTKT